MIGAGNDRALEGLRVIIVEDDALLAMALELALSEQGCDVVGLASNLDDATSLAADASFDGAILDVNLAGERVYPVADILSARGIPFLFATGYGRAGLRESDHASPVLQKPYQVTALVKLLSRWLAPPRPS